MKTSVMLLVLLFCSSAFSANGIISVSRSTNWENTLDIRIQGGAAKTISKHLTENSVKFIRDSFSGALVQKGEGVRCIDQHKEKPPYCYMAITDRSVK